MKEHDLLGPCAGGPLGTAQLKTVAEDFQVNEVLDIPFSGEGEHLWLWVEKRYLNTEEVAKKIAQAAHVSTWQVSYAGLKDRLALTRQWFSIQLPGKADPDLSVLESDQLHIIKQIRHQRKLQRGVHSANGFVIRLTHLKADKQAIDARLQQIKQQGVPNYYGVQRFGREGNNLKQALNFAEQAVLPDKRLIRSRVLSTARSYLFNQVLANRVAQGDWDTILDGDILSFSDSHSFFPAEPDSSIDPRFLALDIHPTAPLYGEGVLPTTADVLLREETILAKHQVLTTWLAQAGMRQERRILRLPITNFTWHYVTPECLQLEFTLPTGCFATVVIRELVSLEMMENNTCTY